MKTAERDRKRAEKEAEEEAKSVAKKKWTAKDNATIVRMIGGGSSYSEIASELGKDLNRGDICYRWINHLEESSGIIRPAVQLGEQSCITWTADVDGAIVRMRTDGDSYPKIASELGNGLSTNDIKNRWTCHLKDTLQ